MKFKCTFTLALLLGSLLLTEKATAQEGIITLVKEVSVDGGGTFFDADNPGDADVPVGALGADATYRLIVENVGTTVLINAMITDPTLGLADVPVPGGPLNPGDVRVIDAGAAGFSALFFEDRCDSVGNKMNVARVDAVSEPTGNLVENEDPANVSCEEPAIEILKQVSLTGGAPFFDADNPGDADVPASSLGADATYRLIIRNTGTEGLINAVISDPTLGLVDVPVPGGALNPGDERVIGAGDAGFSNLFFPGRCDSAGNKNNIARIDAEGQDSGTPVSDDDPANVECVERGITIKKQVSVDGGGTFFDADNPGDADVPVGVLGADATYRLIVENVGTTVLINAMITDPTLGLADVPVPGGPLNPGDVRVIDAGDAGFSALFFEDRCDSVGNKMNVARVDAVSEPTGNLVENEDPANVSCEEPAIEILKQVSLTGGAPFFDADNPGDADVPASSLGADATYRLIIRNTGTEGLINAVISDPTLGLVDVPVPGGALNPGDERVIGAGDAGFSNLFFPGRCDSAGNKNNIARIDAEGQDSGTPVSDDDPANVECVERGITIKKQVSVDGGGTFFDADNPGDADVPVGALGADATYRLIVENVGTTVLINAMITDPTLGLADVPVPGGPLNPGDVRVIDAGAAGFSALFFEDRCDSVGNKMNVARVDAVSEPTGNLVEDEDPANVNCCTDSDGDGVCDDQDDCPNDPDNDADDDTVCGDVDACSGTEVPEGVPTGSLKTNRWALVDGDGAFDTTAPKGKGPQRSFSIQDTGGCSCEQIIAIQGLGKGHTKFGCSISAMEDWILLLNP